MFHATWGHVITDNIRRIWFLQSEPFKHEFKDCPLIYVQFGNFKRLDLRNFWRLFEILGVNLENLYPVTQPTQFDKIILPDESFYRSQEDQLRHFTNEYRETIEQVRDFALTNRASTSLKRIYYLHGSRGQFGEERVAQYFNSKGYEIVRPEKLTLDEQLNLLINCESFASTLGSISHNSIFLRDDAEAVFFVRAPYRFTGYQALLNQVRELKATYVDCSLSLLYRANEDYCYIVSKQLKSFFGDKWGGYEEEDFITFLHYVRNALDKGNAVSPNAMKYYGEVFTDFLAQLKQREDLITACNMPKCWEQFRPWLSYQTHVDHNGWGAWQSENQFSNPPDQRRDIQAVKIKFPNHKLHYSVYYGEAEGWSAEVSNGEQAGTVGKNKSIFGMKVYFDEATTKKFDILYRMHTFDGEWTPWAKNGEVLYSYGVKLNALQIKLEPKSDATKE